MSLGAASTRYSCVLTAPSGVRPFLEGSSRLSGPKKRKKKTISTRGGFGRLQMVLEPDTERCANKDLGPPRGVDCEIPHRLERGMKHSL